MVCDIIVYPTYIFVKTENVKGFLLFGSDAVYGRESLTVADVLQDNNKAIQFEYEFRINIREGME